MTILRLPTKAQPRELVRDGDLIPDNRLAAGAQDLLEHDAIARGVAEIAWTVEAPVNIALFGAWGSGKSSVYSMVEQHLARIAPKKVKVARYDAWKYGGRELKRNFIDSLAQELDLDHKPEFSHGLEIDQETPKLRTLAWFNENVGSLAFGVLLAVGVAALWVVVQALATVAFTDDHFKATVNSLIPQAGSVFGLALVATLVGPRVFEGAVRTKKTPAPEGADQFANRFKQLVDAALVGKAERLVVFIDELDRCDPKDVVATLRDLKTFLDQKDCVFIVAADREVIERSLADLPQAKPVREDEPYYATAGAFLDKIFQHQIALPPLRSRALTKFAHDLVDHQDGIWKELRDHDEEGTDTFDRTVFALIPVHVRSPRRVKVLLNNFATNARIAESRGIEWLNRAHELAVLTVLQTEFPAVTEDLRRMPRLLDYLRGQGKPTGSAVEVLVKYTERPAPVEPKPATEVSEVAEAEAIDATEATGAMETAAGRLLSDDKTPVGAKERALASANLRRHLMNYIDKVAAAGIRDPRPDLLYLQAAAGRENLPDPALGDAIDYATDTAPDTVVATFASYESATLAIAIPLLITEGDNESMPGQAFAYESACRLIERLDPDDQGPITALVAPSLLAAVVKNTLSLPSLPGALLVAAWEGVEDAARHILKTARDFNPSEDLVDSLTAALPYLRPDGQDLLVAMLAERFDRHPQPLLTALRDSSTSEALDVWEKVNRPVLEVLNELELRGVEDAEEATAAATRTAAAGAAAAAAPATPEVPEATGEGIALLERLIDAVRSRNVYEQLLSVVLQSVQSEHAAAPLRQWVEENADRLVGAMADPVRRAWHALIALEEYPATSIATWSALLPEYNEIATPASADDSDGASGGHVEQLARHAVDDALLAAVTEAANNLLAHLLDAFATADIGDLGELAALSRKVAEWSSTVEGESATTISQTLSKVGWDGGAEDDVGGQLLWQRKTALFETAAALATNDRSPLYAPFVGDLAALLSNLTLSSFATQNWREMCRGLPQQAAAALSGHVDEYQPTASEGGTVMMMRLTARAVAGNDAPPASELIALPAEQQSTALTDAWLDLSPPADQARDVVTQTTLYTPAALRKYCNTLGIEARTSIWTALFENAAASNVLEAAGVGGLGSDAVTRVRGVVAKETREPERARHVNRLKCAKPAAGAEAAAVRKVSSEFAADLLDKGTGGDLRSAADIVLWAGGAGYGHKETLRAKFTELAERHDKALPKRTASGLVNAGVLTVSKKGFLASLLRR